MKAYRERSLILPESLKAHRTCKTVTLREQLKLELDAVDDATIAIVHQILMLLKKSEKISPKDTINWRENNPLKNSIISETDMVAPIDEIWDVER